MMDEKLFRRLHLMFVKFTVPPNRGIEEFLFDKNFRLLSYEFREIVKIYTDKKREERENDERNL